MHGCHRNHYSAKSRKICIDAHKKLGPIQRFAIAVALLIDECICGIFTFCMLSVVVFSVCGK